jgi:hypothetical protein
MNKYYAGIGSRKTPPDILEIMNKVAFKLGQNSFTLRSGGADGADTAFEDGAIRGSYPMQIFIPWKYFNQRTGPVYPLPDGAMDLVKQIHPAFDRLSDAAKILHARNCQQILGPNLDSPSSFVICWTPNGEAVGGTATAIKLAQLNNIPVFNLGTTEALERLRKYLGE